MQWDRPCIYHKQEQACCETCSYYIPQGMLILIIKLRAFGDVLRTTSLLTPLKKKYPQSTLVWLTSAEALPVLSHIAEIDRVIACGSREEQALYVMHFDLLLNPDAAPESAVYAQKISAYEKLGFGLDERGCVIPFNDEAQDWLLMGLFDDIKKANQKTYQAHLNDMFRLSQQPGHVLVQLTQEEKMRGLQYLYTVGYDPQRGPCIGINTGAGKRWLRKNWDIDRYRQLIKLLLEGIPCQIVLLGGKDQKKNHEYLVSQYHQGVISGGTQHSVRMFFSLINCCDIIVTSDTLALHTALGLQKKVVVLIGPTSASELELYGLGKKIVSSKPCVCCYRTTCEETPSCMDVISVEEVCDTIKEMVDAYENRCISPHL